MIGQNSRWIIVATLAATLLPSAAFGQTQPASVDLAKFRSALERAAVGEAERSALAAPRVMSRGHRMAIGAGLGAVAGLFIGEVWLGQTLDFPHGPDMLIGAGAFAVVGALIARSFGGTGSSAPAPPKKTISVAPVLSKSTKAVVVRLSLK